MNLNNLVMSVIQSNAGKRIYHQGAPRHVHGYGYAGRKPGKTLKHMFLFISDLFVVPRKVAKYLDS